ncbi:hypothetical protein DIPPA_62912 [Diplonema papillatum]|nr:hypothetical protein DIPPA_62912 [Diplonema papillatum]
MTDRHAASLPPGCFERMRAAIFMAKNDDPTTKREDSMCAVKTSLRKMIASTHERSCAYEGSDDYAKMCCDVAALKLDIAKHVKQEVGIAGEALKHTRSKASQARIQQLFSDSVMLSAATGVFRVHQANAMEEQNSTDDLSQRVSLCDVMAQFRSRVPSQDLMGTSSADESFTAKQHQQLRKKKMKARHDRCSVLEDSSESDEQTPLRSLPAQAQNATKMFTQPKPQQKASTHKSLTKAGRSSLQLASNMPTPNSSLMHYTALSSYALFFEETKQTNYSSRVIPQLNYQQILYNAQELRQAAQAHFDAVQLPN